MRFSETKIWMDIKCRPISETLGLCTYFVQSSVPKKDWTPYVDYCICFFVNFFNGISKELYLVNDIETRLFERNIECDSRTKIVNFFLENIDPFT